MKNPSRPWYKKVLRFILKFIIGLVSFVLLYLFFAWILALWTSNSDFEPCSEDCYTVYIHSNGIHTDIVVPVVTPTIDWNKLVHAEDTKAGFKKYNYVAFGWGDKGFYLDTPEWSDLKVSTALTAMFYLGTSAMHVTFHNELKESDLCKKVSISVANYENMKFYILNSFETTESKDFQLIEGASYGERDLFYEGKGSYSLFYTCNTWANSCLKASGMKACMWTPYDKSILSKY